MTKRILHLDKCEQTAKFVNDALIDCEVTTFNKLSLTQNEVLAHHYDLIITDLILADADQDSTFSWLKSHFEKSPTPVIIYSENIDLSNKILALNIGASDYISKPAHPLEFRARAINCLNKNQNSKPTNNTIKNIFGTINLQPTLEVCRKNCPVGKNCKNKQTPRLTPTEYRLLHYFFENAACILTRPDIQAAVWGHDTHINPRSIDKHIHTLKIKITDCNIDIECVYGRGYRLFISDELKMTYGNSSVDDLKTIS